MKKIDLEFYYDFLCILSGKKEDSELFGDLREFLDELEGFLEEGNIYLDPDYFIDLKIYSCRILYYSLLLCRRVGVKPFERNIFLKHIINSDLLEHGIDPI